MFLALLHKRPRFPSCLCQSSIPVGCNCGGVIAHRRQENNSFDAMASFVLVSPIGGFLASGRMSGQIYILHSLSANEIDGTSNNIGTVGKHFMRAACRLPHISLSILEYSRNTMDLIVSPIVERQNGSFRIYKVSNDFQLTEHRTRKAMYPNNNLLRPLGTKPQSVQNEFLRRRYFDDMARHHTYVPSCQLERYFFWSAVRVSIEMPIEASFIEATVSSIFSGTS